MPVLSREERYFDDGHAGGGDGGRRRSDCAKDITSNGLSFRIDTLRRWSLADGVVLWFVERQVI